MDTKKVLEISEKQRTNWTFLSIFSKKQKNEKKQQLFLHFKTVIILSFILQFLKESNTSEYNVTY